MKKLITLVIFMITLGVNTVTAQKYIQIHETDEVVVQEEIKPLKELHRQFDTNVPWKVRSDSKIISKVLKDAKVRLSTKMVKGTYDYFVLYYTPKTQSQIVYRNLYSKDEIRISYNSSFEQFGKQQFAWWYLLWIIGLIAMRISSQQVNNVFTIFIAFFSLIIGYIIFMFVCPMLITLVVMLIVLLIALVSIVLVMFPKNEKTTDFWSIVYYICIITMMVLAYY